MASPSKKRLDVRDPRYFAQRVEAAGFCAPGNSTTAWGTMLKIRPVISRSKPFMTLTTTVSVMTPSASPANDTQLMSVA